MLQKETQKWETDPAFVDAITSILDGSKAVLDTRVLALSATYEAPFSKIKAAGNGFTIERKFYKEVTEELLYDDATLDKNRQVSVRKEIKPGDPVKVGDKIRVEYQIWNGENRSFVKLDAAREAALRPVLTRRFTGASVHTWAATWRLLSRQIRNMCSGACCPVVPILI